MGRGGKRAGAGRRKRLTDCSLAERILAQAGEEARWHDLLSAKDQRLRFDALRYLTDRRDGKPVQALQHITEKPVEINVTIRRIGS